MKTSQSFHIHYTIRADKAKDGKARIYACITVNKERSFIALKQLIDIKSWDSGKGIAKGNREEIKSINNYLGQVRTMLGSCYQQLQLKGRMLSAEAIKDAFLGKGRTSLICH